MGIDTKGIFKDYVTPEQIVEYLQSKTNCENVRSEVKSNVLGKLDSTDFDLIQKNNSDNWEVTSGFIIFDYYNVAGEKETRMMYYFYDNISSCEEIKNFIDYRLQTSENKLDLIQSYIKSCVTVSLGYWGDGIEIISDLMKHFGGWVDENDCDEIHYKYFEKEV
jgi:hypothetical protein